MNAATAAAHESQTLLNTRTTAAKGDLVLVLPGYSMDTRARTNIDAWTDTYMVVFQVCQNGDYLLGYDGEEGEVYVNESRLVKIN